jgi:biotin carboxylase
VKTTIPLHEAIMRDPDFVRGKYDTELRRKIFGKRRRATARIVAHEFKSP